MNTASTTPILSRGWGIRAKIVLPLAGVAFAVSIVGVGVIHHSQTHQRERHLIDRSAAIAHSVMHVAETVSDAGQIQRFVTSMASEPGVELIIVAAGDPLTVVASSRPEWLGQPTTNLPDPPRMRDCLERALAAKQERLDLHHNKKDSIDYTRPLRMRLHQRNALTWAPGAIMLHLDGAAIRQEQNSHTTRLVIALLTTIVLTSIVTYFLIQVVVLQPVRSIAEVARSTVLGARTARVRLNRTDELGRLGERFDMMLDELACRESLARQAREDALQAKGEAEAALAELACHKLALDEHAIVAVTDPAGRITYVNDRFCDISKYDREELIGQNHRIINSGHHYRGFWKEMWRTIGGGQVWRNEVCNRAKDGSLYWVDTTVVPYKDSTGKITQYVAIRADVSDRKLAEAALRESKEQFELAVRGSNDGIWDWNVLTGEVFYSQRFKELLEFGSDEFLNRFESFQDHLHHDDAQSTLDALQDHLEHGTPFDVTVRMCTRSGEWRWFRARGEAVRGSNGRARRMAGSISDISSLKRVEEELTRAARLDKLTGLPNRGLFLDRLQQTILRGQRSERHTYAVMFLDFDRFKLINDSLGHNVGDALLKGIATRLSSHVRSVDSVSRNVSGHTSARLGGDEFVVLLDDLRQPIDALAIADRLLEAFATPHQLGKHEVYSTASIGIVYGDPTYERAEDVIRDADTAMYEAKRQGKARYVVFDSSMRERVQRHLKLENDLRKAIGTSQIYLAYQPIVSLRTGVLYGVESLMRWDHPTDGLIEPTEFVPIAEDSDLIQSLGEWALGESCRQLAEWQSTMGSLAPRKMCVNLSRKQFAMPNLAHIVKRAVAESGVDPARVQLEITEDAFVGNVGAGVRAMKAIKDLGIELAIDDFGVGTSSFASLNQFPVDVLKVHRSMLTGIEDSRDVASLIHGLAVMVKNLGIEMVAKGVETAGQLIALQELGCDFAQGFFFSVPLRADEMKAFAVRVLGIDYNARGAAAYAQNWTDRLPVFQAMDDDLTT